MPRLLLNVSRVSFQVFHTWLMCCTTAQCVSVLENWLRHWRFHLQLQKLCCRGIFRWCWTNQGANWSLGSKLGWEKYKNGLERPLQSLERGSTELETRFGRTLNDCKQAKNRGKTVWKHGKNWLRQRMTSNLNILTGLNDPFLFVKACPYRFQPFFTRTGCRSRRTAAKNLEERDKTCQRSVPCLSTIFDRSVLSGNISDHQSFNPSKFLPFCLL